MPAAGGGGAPCAVRCVFLAVGASAAGLLLLSRAGAAPPPPRPPAAPAPEAAPRRAAQGYEAMADWISLRRAALAARRPPAAAPPEAAPAPPRVPAPPPAPAPRQVGQAPESPAPAPRQVGAEGEGDNQTAHHGRGAEGEGDSQPTPAPLYSTGLGIGINTTREDDLRVAQLLMGEGVLQWAAKAPSPPPELTPRNLSRALRKRLLVFRDGTDSPFDMGTPEEAAAAVRGFPCWQRATRIRAELVVLNRDRARLLAEWAAWHLAIGVAHLYVYDDSSRDNSRPALAALEKAGFVTIMDSKKWDWADKRAADPLAHHQFATYLEFVKYRRRAGAEGPAIPEPPASKGTQSVWVGMLDQDEFLLPTQHECVGEVIEPLLHAHSVGALYVPWTRLGHANVTDYALVRNATLFESTAWSVGESEGVGCATRRESIFHGTGSACWGLGKSIAKLSLIEDSARSYMAMDRDRTFPHVVPLRGELKTANELGWTLPTRFEIKRCSPKVRGVGVSRELLRWKLRCEITLGRLRDQLTQWHAWRANPAHFPTVIVHARSTAFTAVVLPTLDRGRQSAKHGLARRRGLAALWRDFIEEDLGRGFVPLPAQAMPLARRRAALVRRLLRMGSLAPPKVLRPERFDGWARRRPPR
eukprot:TRINITY_DN16406_c0_g1_i1.p2 TRINITY_DN16406_c0_g1~~TRINITY_DN16406_c0_g1_i1.p2  ORF type:complete len:687 (+),score=231.61 TRINITY_DN16406_c0_g1_i1:137-2062(+)